ncbi:carbamoyl-phosphate synthase large subunit [Chlamydiota bacterium]
MPKRTDIKKILLIGSGPIVISQACEFDYSGSQACKALKEEGFHVVLINSNPATIMTDPEIADSTYIEPITPFTVEKIIEKERPCAVLPTMGGQTALNVAVKLYENGVFDRYNVQMIGAHYDAIKKAEDREYFKDSMNKIGLDLPRSGLAHTMADAVSLAREIGYPLIIRPSFTLGGTGGGIAVDDESFNRIAQLGLDNSMTSEVLIEESIIGWKEYELEVMRDVADNVVIICSIENVDPMGIHTGDSITVAPAQTLTDKCYQQMRDASIKIIREIGVETGGSNIQFAVDPQTGRMVVIEMNPRVSRSSALASKATGFPIAKIAAKLSVGYTLDEIQNDITKETPASFEPTIDYCVVKIPRFTFEKFPEADSTLGISMKSVGETMAIGRTFKEALQKGLRGLETGHCGLDDVLQNELPKSHKERISFLKEKLTRPNAERILYIKPALQEGISVEELFSLSYIDPWFLSNIKDIVDFEANLVKKQILQITDTNASRDLLLAAKKLGFSDKQLSSIWNTDEDTIRSLRKALGVHTTFKLVDTCAAEFEAYTPYFYSTYETEDETRLTDMKKIMILGGGPNRIGQGIEFDYCCCHASFALKEIGYETIMVNSNPETVSTDYDTSDKLYFEPITREDILNIIDREKPDGIIVQFGGQTPLNIARDLYNQGAPIIGTSVDSIDRAEDRDLFRELLKKLDLTQPPNGIAFSFEEAKKIAVTIGYPVLVRPSFVLGGRAMKIVYSQSSLEKYIKQAAKVSGEKPVLIDKFIEGAIEVDVDALADGATVIIGGVMEHIEEAGIHSGDSACVLPPYSLTESMLEEIKSTTKRIAQELQVIGLLNIQYAVKGSTLYVLEVNPRASRTVPFVSKATGLPIAKIAAKVMAGVSLREQGITTEITITHMAVKESVLPFSRFSGVDTILGPEMKSTGEVMGIDYNFGMAFAKAQLGANQALPLEGTAFISVKDEDKREIIYIAKKLFELGFNILATSGTAKVLNNNNVTADVIRKAYEGSPNIIDLIKERKIGLIINTPSGENPHDDEVAIRSTGVMVGIPYITTIAGARAAVNGIESMKTVGFSVDSVQDYHSKIK